MVKLIGLPSTFVEKPTKLTGSPVGNATFAPSARSISGNGNATVSVTGLGLWLRNTYRTVTLSGVMVRSSDSIETSAFFVKTSPPTASSAEESLARDTDAPASQPTAAQVANMAAK